MTEEITTETGIFRVTLLVERLEPIYREVVSMKRYVSEDIVDLKSTMEVADLTLKARDRAIVSRKRLTKPKGTSPSTPPTSKSPVT